jgi:hypothetical protein
MLSYSKPNKGEWKMRDVLITKKSSIILQNFELLIDGENYSERINSNRKDVLEKLVEVLNYYKRNSIQTNQKYYCELWNMSLIIKEDLDLKLKKEGIKSSHIKSKFYFLENSPFYYKKYEDEDFYYYQYKGSRMVYGEIQYFYIKIPKNLSVQIQSNYKLIKNGVPMRRSVKERPQWFKELWEKAKVETRDLYKIAKLFETI